ncbi:hypothetical protein [Nocardia carnea]|uniref:hypothetical protein n=1 Tax=Nocardia carnea TaxID=37328 RepID=UPI002454A876|nr:hypothetical protein [Nocardia carnea]
MTVPTEFRYRDNARYHLHSARDEAARAEHAAVSRRWRHELADAVFNARDRHMLLAAVRDGVRVSEAAAAVGVTHQQVYGRTEWDPDFRDALEEALTTSCPAGAYCGTPSGKRRHGGRCLACRRAHRRSTTIHETGKKGT